MVGGTRTLLPSSQISAYHRPNNIRSVFQCSALMVRVCLSALCVYLKELDCFSLDPAPPVPSSDKHSSRNCDASWAVKGARACAPPSRPHRGCWVHAGKVCARDCHFALELQPSQVGFGLNWRTRLFKDLSLCSRELSCWGCIVRQIDEATRSVLQRDFRSLPLSVDCVLWKMELCCVGERC